MDASRHMVIRELDLSDCNPSSIADRINAVPGLKTSTAFFTFLRANLALNPSAVSSQTNTPMLHPATSQTLPPPSPSPLAESYPLIPVDDIPPLSLEVLGDEDDKLEALQLVANSIAQQRQVASRTLILHPLCLLGLASALAAAYHYGYVSEEDAGLAVMFCCGAVVAYLLAVSYFTMGYKRMAKNLQWWWLRNEDGEEDTILGTRFGDEIIATVVLRLEPSHPHAGGKRRSRNFSLKGGKGVIRAWTTRAKYRGRGIGADMLHEAVRVTREKCGKDAEVGFAKEHANSTMILPEIFNGPFRRRERMAAKALENILDDGRPVKRRDKPGF